MRFRFLGELPNPVVETMGSTVKFTVPTQRDGGMTYLPVPPATEFVIGEDVGYDFEDGTSIRALQCDPRFEEI